MRRAFCNAIGCHAATLDTEAFCQRHWVMLESDTQKVIGRTFRPGKPPTASFNRALEFARREILFLQTNGHRIPRDRDFQWDDDERTATRERI